MPRHNNPDSPDVVATFKYHNKRYRVVYRPYAESTCIEMLHHDAIGAPAWLPQADIFITAAAAEAMAEKIFYLEHRRGK